MNEYMKGKLTYNVTMMVAGTLCLILLAMVGAFVGGLFVPNDVIDNKDLFPLIGPAFQTIVGGFIGLLAGVKLSSGEEKPAEKK
jgi:hypothetical protein